MSSATEGVIPRVRRANRRTSLLALFAVAVLAIAPGLVRAQTSGKDEKTVKGDTSASTPAAALDANQVAATVQSFYDQTRNVSARFYQTYVHALYQRTDRSKGSVVFEKPGKMRWDYDLPNGKVIASDGNKLTIYEPGEEGEAGQYLLRDIGDEQLPQALTFLTGTGRLEESFSFRLLDPVREGFASGQVLELRPLTPSPHFERILFYVESDPRVRGLVRRVLIIDPAGNRNRLDFSQLAFNREVQGALFEYRPPRGARLIKTD